jgi:N6-adenosine-specific RNA methylase IME4
VNYGAILADPPWPVKVSGGRTTAGASSGSKRTYERRPMPYRTMPVEDIAALPVERLAATDAHLFMWTLDRFVLDGSAQRVMRAWGFEPWPRMIVWHKASASLGRTIRAAHELILLGTRGAARWHEPSLRSVVDWPQVYENGAKVHSAKPEHALDFVEQMAAGPYLELFARRERHRLGWDTWGDEAFNHITLGEARP